MCKVILFEQIEVPAFYSVNPPSASTTCCKRLETLVRCRVIYVICAVCVVGSTTISSYNTSLDALKNTPVKEGG